MLMQDLSGVSHDVAPGRRNKLPSLIKEKKKCVCVGGGGGGCI